MNKVVIFDSTEVEAAVDNMAFQLDAMLKGNDQPPPISLLATLVQWIEQRSSISHVGGSIL